MASRTLRYSLGLLALVAAQWALAVGLGEIKLQSAMNEPLRAEIALLSVGDLNESQIAAKLASPEDFQRAGVEREFQLADLHFKVDLSNTANPVIRVSSRHPMKEPYLNFLLELRWTSGRLLREYTLLLDLPVFAGALSAGKTVAAVPSTAADSPRSSAPASEPSRRSPAHGAARTSAPANGSYRVQAGDTLWRIAVRNQPQGVTAQQAMQAILAANPDAFIRANPNLIRRDAVLNLPDAAAMAAVDQSRATNQLRAAQPVSDRVIESHTRTAEKSSADSDNGELHLAGDVSSANVNSAAMGSRKSGGASDASHTDIGSALEEKDRVERENAELRARVASLEEQVKAASRLVEISDPALAALQKGGAEKTPDTAAADTEKSADTAAAGSVTPIAEAPLSGQPAESAPNAEAGTIAGQTDDNAAQTSTAPTAPDASGAVPVPVTTGAGDAAAPVAQAVPPADQSPLDAVAKLRSWLVPALGLTGILLLVAMGLAALRGRATQQHGLRLPGEVEAKGTRTAAFDHDQTAPVALDHEDLLPTETSFNEGPDRILEEVDVCLSFGNEQQASELLTGALARYPRHSGLHLKMLELLAQQGDRPGFEAALPKLKALGDPGATESANALLRELQEREVTPTPVVSIETAPGAANPAEVAPVDGGSSLAAENLDFDLDLDLDLPAASPTATAATETRLEVPGELEDFDLGLLDNDSLDNELTNSAQDLVEPPVAATAESWQATSLDGDLDLFEPGQEMATQIELAEAYVDMGDAEGAREILDYVLQGGDEAQKESARQLLARLG